MQSQGFTGVQGFMDLQHQGSKLPFSFGSQLATNRKILVARSLILVANLFYLHKNTILCVTLQAKKSQWKSETIRNNTSNTYLI